MAKKRVRFKARITPMGDKYVIVIPKFYHTDFDKREWVSKVLYVDVTDEKPE
jgi:hypothetical protein